MGKKIPRSGEMKIFLITQSVNNGYDTYDSAVVFAESEEEAIKIHPDNSDKEWFKKADRDYGTWAPKEFVKAEYIGEAKEGTERGVACSSFNAG